MDNVKGYFLHGWNLYYHSERLESIRAHQVQKSYVKKQGHCHNNDSGSSYIHDNSVTTIFTGKIYIETINQCRKQADAHLYCLRCRP